VLISATNQQRMHRIHYTAPTTITEATGALAWSPGHARMLAGGTDLIVQLREELRPDCEIVIDAKRIADLMTWSFNNSGALSVGAAVPCYRIYAEPAFSRVYPALVDAAQLIGGVAIQGRASIGGNLCNSGPAGDSIPALIVHAASCLIAGPDGMRTVPVEEFCTAPGRNVLSEIELLVRLEFPAPEEHAGAAYVRFIPRHEMDIAVVGAAASVVLEDNVIRRARVAIGAVAPTPLLVPEAGDALIGRPAEREAFAHAAALAQAASRPISDMRGTAEHRHHLVGVLVRRALERAVARANGQDL
jgi:carbon-monoxide dehydrogenase medium subunit